MSRSDILIHKGNSDYEPVLTLEEAVRRLRRAGKDQYYIDAYTRGWNQADKRLVKK